MRVALLACGGCEDITAHRHAFAVPGNLDGRPPEGKLEKAQQVVPVITEQPTVVEQLYECQRCGRLRRWGLEVVRGEARGVRAQRGKGGQPAGGPVVEELGG